jgi:hypothetical protein
MPRLREVLGPLFHSGIVLYDGEHVLPYGERLLAPFRSGHCGLEARGLLPPQFNREHIASSIALPMQCYSRILKRVAN